MPRRRSQSRKQWCEFWPDCRCLNNINEWIEQIDDDEPLDPDIVFLSFVSLSCLAAHHPDLRQRRWAAKQLSHRLYIDEHRQERERELRRASRRYQ